MLDPIAVEPLADALAEAPKAKEPVAIDCVPEPSATALKPQASELYPMEIA